MKKTVILLCFLLILALIFPLTVGYVALCTPAQFDQTFLGELGNKIERLNSISSPKIVVIGGSSTAFGLRSDIMQEQLGMPVVNFGLYASLGTKIMLDLSKANISEGDIIIIAPEQDKQTLSTYFNADSAWKGFDGNFQYLKYLHRDDVPSMLGSLVSFAAEKHKYLSKGEKPSVSGVYTKEAFNLYGDISYKREANTMFGGYDKNTPISFDVDIISKDFINYLNQYAQFAKNKGASVFFSFAPMNRAALEENTDSDDIYAYFSYLQSVLDFHVISNPETYLMQSNWFYDSNFHVNDSGAILHTKHLINDIILALHLDKTCSVETPPMPELPDSGQSEQVKNEYFTYSKDQQGIEITGLTEKGKSQFELEVPAQIDDIPVIAISQGAFSANTVVTRITLNHGLAYIADGAFDGCGSLKELIINSNVPSSIRVGEELLSGAEACKIYIPANSYDVYSNDYYWSLYCDNSMVEELE